MPETPVDRERAGTPVSAFPFSAKPVASHRLALSQYMVLAAVMLGASIGDALLSRGMREIGPIPVHHVGLLFKALLNHWVLSGIVVLVSFMASYMTALSWADLTFVQPATAFGNVVTALIGRIWLHESISAMRWLGITLIVIGVGFVANGPSKTDHLAAAEAAGRQS